MGCSFNDCSTVVFTALSSETSNYAVFEYKPTPYLNAKFFETMRPSSPTPPTEKILVNKLI